MNARESLVEERVTEIVRPLAHEMTDIEGGLPAQVVYDHQASEAWFSGEEMHDFFAAEVGDPSPRGDVRVSVVGYLDFLSESVFRSLWNTGYGL